MKTKRQLLDEFIKQINLTPKSVLRFPDTENARRDTITTYHFTEEQLEFPVNDEIETPNSRL